MKPHRIRKLLVANRKNYYGYVKDRGSSGMELYDLKSDIGETRNVAAQHPQVVSELLSLVRDFRWPDELGDTNIVPRKKTADR